LEIDILRNNHKSINEVISMAKSIQLLLTDIDGVLTDGGVYYSARGEEMKRFSIRDGMGVVRLRELAGVETGIITGEKSGSVAKRAEKLKITELYLGIKDKLDVFRNVKEKYQYDSSEIAYIGDDTNDIEIIEVAGLTASPADGMSCVRDIVDYVCSNPGGNGAFREFAELIINAKLGNNDSP
jgi:YrbI family 3-deoxy-D-manno-octulosonate 8-phosphate phosphatase